MRRAVRRALATVALASLLFAACNKGSAPVARTASRPEVAPGGGLHLREAWTWSVPGGASAGMPAADGDAVAFTYGAQHLVLLDGRGHERWTATRVGLRDVAPALTPDTVLAATDDGVAAYDRTTGRERWFTSLGERANSPVVASSRAIVTTWEGELVGLDLGSGAVAWRVQLGGDALGPAATDGERTVVATFDTGHAAGAVAADPAKGSVLWRVPLVADGVSAPAVDGPAGVAIVVDDDLAAHGLALADGQQRWRRPLDGAGSPEVPPLVLADGTAIVAHRLGGLALVEGGDGGLGWQAASDSAAVRGGPAGPGPNGWVALPLYDGRVLFAGRDRPAEARQPPGLVAGVVSGPGGLLVVSTAQGEENGVFAYDGW